MQVFIVSSLKFEVFPNALKFEYIYWLWQRTKHHWWRKKR